MDYWKVLTGQNPEWSYFDSKRTTYEESSELNQRNIHFVTIRRRGPAILQHVNERPANEWRTATIDVPTRRNKKI